MRPSSADYYLVSMARRGDADDLISHWVKCYGEQAARSCVAVHAFDRLYRAVRVEHQRSYRTPGERVPAVDVTDRFIIKEG